MYKSTDRINELVKVYRDMDHDISWTQNRLDECRDCKENAVHQPDIDYWNQQIVEAQVERARHIQRQDFTLNLIGMEVVKNW